MPRTLGYHLFNSCYGLWLPGDDRGSWSEAWDAHIGYYEPHMLHEGDPVRLRMAQERMKHSPVRLSPMMSRAVVDQIRQCAAQSRWKVAAFAIETTRFHLLFTYSDIDIQTTCKWLADQTTKAAHWLTEHRGPVWSRGKWCSFIFNWAQWRNTAAYIQRHNDRQGVDGYDFVARR